MQCNALRYAKCNYKHLFRFHSESGFNSRMKDKHLRLDYLIYDGMFVLYTLRTASRTSVTSMHVKMQSISDLFRQDFHVNKYIKIHERLELKKSPFKKTKKRV